VLWVRYVKAGPQCVAFYMLLRDEEGEALSYKRCDFVPLMPTTRPYEAVTAGP